ncbi:MAG TPA: hypothetical protein VMV88_09985, partial [Gallionella sp.]|nr:hypothetical protein [Gallionella sp.]
MDITLFLRARSNCAPTNIVRQKFPVSCLYKFFVPMIQPYLKSSQGFALLLVSGGGKITTEPDQHNVKIAKNNSLFHQRVRWSAHHHRGGPALFCG